jgi:bla regulator protein blaR1
MTLLIQYLVKLSISLAIVWLFYQLVLRKLTFYNSNRWYLLGYSLLCFFIPFINIAPMLTGKDADDGGIIHFIPSIQQYTPGLEGTAGSTAPYWSASYDKWDWMAFAITVGVAIMLVRFVIRYFSFLRMRRRAELVFVDQMWLYQVNENIIPFSFGNAVFINKELHSESELQEIIRHEFVHVKQKHTIDIIWAEAICILNWYNPFAWLLRSAIRQNLEFIADNKVLENGIQKKQYQYLLLKVMGNDQYSIATKFNFSSLKKRIAMMNKLKTTRVHLLRFLFILPLLAVVLISFRQKKQDTVKHDETTISETRLLRDTIPFANEPNEKGYIITVTGTRPSNSIVIVNDKNGKLVERIPFSKWKESEKYYKDKYGEYPPPPPPAQPPTPPEPPQPMEMPENVKKIDVNNRKTTVVLKDGTEEKYDLSKPEEKAKFEKKYGEVIPLPPAPPPRPRTDNEITAVQEVNVSRVAQDIEITNDQKAHLRLKDGTVEEYNLANPQEKKVFEEKYGKVIEVGSASDLTKQIYYTAPNMPTVATSESPVADVTVVDGQAVIAPRTPRAGVSVVDEERIVAGREDILCTITKKMTQEQLEILIKEMKEKGVTLKINKTEYKNGILVHVEGNVQVKDSHASFSGTDFSKVILSTVERGDRTLIKVDIHVSKQVS